MESQLVIDDMSQYYSDTGRASPLLVPAMARRGATARVTPLTKNCRIVSLLTLPHLSIKLDYSTLDRNWNGRDGQDRVALEAARLYFSIKRNLWRHRFMLGLWTIGRGAQKQR